MAHAPESIEQYVCAACQTMHAGTPVHESGGTHSWDPPAVCGACGDDELVPVDEWTHHHE
ncbi:hypothetical protein GCM10028857_26830 [Salinarchaeum chitinilyticum]